ncbi:cobyrinate a,c-diamide synthase [Zhongshania aliphaticivorans]|uniref:cobyrinate a,c-diamide synthase n=1 Tax=Zhongshania aliphaticivorans TaxID=1470434 RepID=UPI0012E67B99|nr:cobyrinate a,c-diamide synthase [Zhongshania aliphaticivorans]CAA0102892.1 Hydrogenobyrinate a,c-diamide synthase [Zhongshania aliphaticivorans]
MSSIFCPALFIAAPSSGQGKTTITAAIARYHRLQGRKVHIFKMGPDYLDPQILEQASGYPVVQLDLWMAGEDYCRHQFYKAAESADLILVEGAMGMFDGEPSSADLAATFGIPVALLMDVKGMAQTAAALATGLANYRDDVRVVGLIANNCASERHRQLIADALPSELPLLATISRDPDISLPERHLGLVQASEVRVELEACFNKAAQMIAQGELANLPEPVEFKQCYLPSAPRTLEGKRIAIARDEAFSFIYAANLQLLEDMGADLVYFSPIHDNELPAADALWLPGGYPELHAKALAENHKIKAQIRAFYHADKPILAECGGFMYCLENLRDLEGQQFSMLALLDGQAAMRERGGCQGMQFAVLPEGELRAHSHHRSATENTATPISYGRRQRHPAPGESIYRIRGLTASYLHLFFPSNPKAITALFNTK